MKSLLQHKWIIITILGGVLLRLVFAFLFTHPFDYFTFLALAKSTVDTGNLIDGFYVVTRVASELQIHGRLYYQILGIWLTLLDKLHLINLMFFFDTKAHTSDIKQYMPGFYSMPPYLFELVIVKMLQLLWDGLYLFFLVKTAEILQLKNKRFLVLFWALNAYAIFTSYAMFQSDLSMLAMLMGGIYYALRHMKEKSHSLLSGFKVISIVLFAIGTAIKLVPALIFPIFLILFSSTFISFITSAGIFAALYLLITQPWLPDNELMKQFFLNSPESTAIFTTQYNKAPLILFALVTIYLAVFIWKKYFLKNPVKIIYAVLLLLSCIYLAEDSNFMYPQFNNWIVPFIALLSLETPIFTVWFIAPWVGYLKRALIDSLFFTGSLSVTFGAPLHELLAYPALMRSIINPMMIDYVFNVTFFLLYISFAVLLVAKLLGKNWVENTANHLPFLKKIQLKHAAIFALASYFIILVGDYTIKHQFATIKSGSYDEYKKEIILTTKPIVMNIDNPHRKTLTAFDVKLMKRKVTLPDRVILRFKDRTSNQLLLEQKIDDHAFPDNEQYTSIILKKHLNNEKMSLEISKETGDNKIVAVERKKVPNYTYYDYGLSTYYQASDNDHAIDITFPQETGLELRVRGVYTMNNVFGTIKHHIEQKPKIYYLYFAIIGLLGVGMVGLYVQKQK